MKSVETLIFDNAKEFKKYLKGISVMPESFNRSVKETHVANMKKSIESIGVQRAIIVIETDVFDGINRLYTADGQHLRNAILSTDDDKLGKHFVVFVNTTDSLGDIIPFISRMNSTAKNWTSDDYLTSWARHGLENYIYIKQRKKETHLSVNMLVSEVYGRSVSIKLIDEFKNGDLVINRAQGTDILRTFDEACSLGLTRCNASLTATARILKTRPNLKGDFLSMIQSNRTTFSHKLNRDAYITLFKNFLNIDDTRKPNKVKIGSVSSKVTVSKPIKELETA